MVIEEKSVKLCNESHLLEIMAFSIITHLYQYFGTLLLMKFRCTIIRAIKIVDCIELNEYKLESFTTTYTPGINNTKQTNIM